MPGDSLVPPPPSLQVNTHVRQPSDGDETITPSGASTISNPFLTPSRSNPFLTPSQRSRASSFAAVVDVDAALRPDPGTEDDFKVDNNPFAFSPGHLNKLLNPKSDEAFRALGGLRGLERGLQTDLAAGLSVDETEVRSTITFNEATTGAVYHTEKPRSGDADSSAFGDRIRIYGKNVLPAKKATSLWILMWRAYNDKVLILLTIAAIISLALGLYETFAGRHNDGASVDWIEGVGIIVAIIIVTAVGSLNDWQKERAFVKLNAKKDDRQIKVIRSGKSTMINVHDLLVGDILHLEPGDLIPVDGIFIDGHDLKCDESSATGESDAIKKVGGDQFLRMIETGRRSKNVDAYIISGAKVLEGMGTFVCTSVGVNSSFGKIMMSVRTEMDATPLQKKLEKLAMAIAKLGSTAAILLFTVLLCRFIASVVTSPSGDPSTDAFRFMDILIVTVTIIVVAVPEGLPLAVTLALAFATNRLLKQNNLVRILRACETMGNATTICSDKTGTLTTNKMTVVAGTFGESGFTKSDTEEPGAQTVSQWASGLPDAAKQIIVQSVAINSTAFEGLEDGLPGFIGSKTETALLMLAKDHLGMQSLSEVRANEQIVQIMPFDSSKKCMAAVVHMPSGGYRLLVKGASEILINYCTKKADMSTLDSSRLTDSDRRRFGLTIDAYAKKSLRTISLVYRDFPEWPPVGMQVEGDHVELSAVLHDLVFLGVVGIQDPVRPGVPEAVKKAQHAGVVVRMVTGDNAVTAQAIATECGIYTDGVIMEGPVFRALSDEEMNSVLPKLQVLARSSPEDKRILVTRLKALGETVAVTGDGTNDAPALKAADVGFSMGIAGTEVAKEASAIVLMDDNFSSIIEALKWGRAVNDAVQKFLQFQITVNITAVLLAFISAVSNPDMTSVLTAVQLLWVNLIMDTFAALALATDPPTERILDRPPQPKSAPLITMNMWKMIIGQAIFQLAVTLTLYFAGDKILGLDTSDSQQALELDTIVFNTFVWMQIFNEFNNRRLDNRFNIFEGVHRNKFFIFINCIMVGAQVAIIFVGGAAFSIKSLNGTQWAICLVVAFVSLPWAVVIRLFPDAWFERLVHIVGKPVLAVYRPLRRWLSRLGSPFKSFYKKACKPLKEKIKKRSSKAKQKLRRSRKGEGEKNGGEGESSGATSDPVTEQSPQSPPTINIEDVERGSS